MRRGEKGKVLQLLQRRCVADGIKHVYRQYRQRKWRQVQKLVVSIVHTMHPNSHPAMPLPHHHDDDTSPAYEEEQVIKYAQTMMVAQCNFSRFD
ncbi:hypothetical protein FSP39_025509 [Pinctada imbricata]|uniref:Uncharacterized protein n=1 Tax=Pinctada imbricata TaxID=66713 RepID=A0AA89BY40_PINIB|nr:hypothetical protein FSP39_025509 [Pinctada imbricata]